MRNGPQILRTVQADSPVDTGFLRSQHRLGPLRLVSGAWTFTVIASTDYARLVYVGWKGRTSTRRVRVGGRTAIVVNPSSGGYAGNKWIERAFRKMFAVVRDTSASG